MKNDIVFLVGLIFPLYFAGYGWVINIARTDRKLYEVIEKFASKLILLLSACAAGFAALFIVVGWNNENRDWTLFMIVFPFFFLVAHILWSRDFFRAVAGLPQFDDKTDKNDEKTDKPES